MIDTHCHIDLYKNPIKILQECENAGITVLAMTNLPSHFEMGYPHILPFKRIRLALGMHPLHAEQHYKEFPLFLKTSQKPLTSVKWDWISPGKVTLSKKFRLIHLKGY